MYNPANGFIIYCANCYASDAWNPLDYGREYDFSKPFFVQFSELLKQVPRRALLGVNPGENTEYSNFVFNSKDSFLSYSVVKSEFIYHSRGVDYSKNCLDCTNIKECESSYWILQGARNYNCRNLVDSHDCLDSAFLYDCANCSSCFMSSNLRNQKYVFRGQQLDKDSYNEAIKKIEFGSFVQNEELKKEFKFMIENNAIHRYANIFKSPNSTGNYIENSKNVKQSFEIFGAEDSKFGWRLVDNPKDIYDVIGSGKSELAYESVGITWGTRNSCFINLGANTTDSQYCDYCMNVADIFGSISVNKGQYVIMNRQYTKDEYFDLVEKIKNHMNEMPYVDEQGRVFTYGEFFPQICVPYAYNETLAQEYFPIDESKALTLGYFWRPQEKKTNKPTIDSKDVPDLIVDVADDILAEAIGCSHEGNCPHQCTTAFKIHPEELAYLRKWKIPAPRLCPNCRHYERNELRAPMKLWDRQCMCDKTNHGHTESCPNEFETSYSSDRPEKIYCESCYQKEVF